MKRLIAFVLTMALVFAITGCGNQEINIAGKIYTYENVGAGGDFTISIREDGTFSYYEGVLSSYIGMGAWSVDGSVLTLTDRVALPVITSAGEVEEGQPFVNRFQIKGDALVFVEEGSSNFLYIKVKNGERFFGAPMEEPVPQLSSLDDEALMAFLDEKGVTIPKGLDITNVRSMIEKLEEDPNDRMLAVSWTAAVDLFEDLRAVVIEQYSLGSR